MKHIKPGRMIAVLLLLLVTGLLPVLHSQTTHSLTVSWTAPTTGGAVVSYNVKRSTSAGSEAVIASVPATQTSYVDTAGVAGTKYFYVVSASNSFGESPNSNEVSAIFLGDSPAAPVSLGVISK
jgi:fibronectin type 3 domain-containing protein